LGAHATRIYSEIDRDLAVDDRPEGAGTDAAFAALETKGPVVERLGLQGCGAHTTDNEYVLIDSIAPRLYLNVRLISESLPAPRTKDRFGMTTIPPEAGGDPHPTRRFEPVPVARDQGPRPG
jgi:hypothetical protein